MRKNPERVAWVVLATAFVVFCILAVGIPLGIRSYLFKSTENQNTELRVIDGTVLVQKARQSELTAVTSAADLSPGDEVLTDSASWATLDLFERSHLTLYSNTSVKLADVKSTRFSVSDEANRVTLEITGGLVRIGVALPIERATTFEVVTPQTTLRLDEGSYRIEVTNQGTQVTVVRGQALITGSSVRMILPQGMRTFVDLSGQTVNPMPAARNLIRNGNFQDPLATTWVTNTVVLTSSVEPPRLEVVEDGSRGAVRLVRRAQRDGEHTEISIHQKLDQDVRDFMRLVVSLDVILEFQSLSGGGQLSSEFPIIVRLDYKDRWGNDKFWTRGFYYQNQAGYPIALDPWGLPSGMQIPRGVWYPYESSDLMALLGDNRPVHITGLTVYASGWDYDSLVSEIQLIVE